MQPNEILGRQPSKNREGVFSELPQQGQHLQSPKGRGEPHRGTAQEMPSVIQGARSGHTGWGPIDRFGEHVLCLALNWEEASERLASCSP